MPRIGVIGGSGLYQMNDVKNIRRIKLDTPFGDPSDEFILGEIEGKEIAFLPRHGHGHKLMPTEVNNRANIYAMKELGVEWIISVSAVGSLKEDIHPLDIVIIDQFFDRSNQARANTFFGNGIVAHIPFAQPLCKNLRTVLFDAGKEVDAPVKWNGTYINVEGPAFSTLAESETFRAWGMDVIGMTNMYEARLAREAEICYATMAMVTDYDCWYEAETGMTVSVDVIIDYLNKNVENARKIIKQTIKTLPEKHDCDCQNVLAKSLITDKSIWPEDTKMKLKPILKKYF